MIVVLLSAFSLLAFDAQAAAPPPAAATPLREVTYRVTEAVANSGSSESFSGMNSNNAFTKDQGTVTVGIMAVANDALGLQVTELMNTKGHPYSFVGGVSSDGSVNFGPETINDASRELLQYFGPHFIPSDKTLDVGSVWNVNFKRSGVDVQTEFKVTKLDGDLLTVRERQTVKFSANNATATTDATIVLKPSKLVPISGDVRKTVRRVTPEGGETQVLTIHFERVSDSRDVAAK